MKKELPHKKAQLVKDKFTVTSRLILLSLAGEILRGLYSGLSYRGIRQAWNTYERKTRLDLNNQLWRLERAGLITRTGRGADAVVQLTETGRRRIKRLLTDDLQAPKQLPWDGKWHMVIFDVPETHRLGRDLLRKKLRQLGCLQLQRSVFIYPYSFLDMLQTIRDAYDLRTDIYYLVVERFGGSQQFAERFRTRGVFPQTPKT